MQVTMLGFLSDIGPEDMRRTCTDDERSWEACFMHGEIFGPYQLELRKRKTDSERAMVIDCNN